MLREKGERTKENRKRERKKESSQECSGVWRNGREKKRKKEGK